MDLGLKDLIYIGGSIGGLCATYFRQVRRSDKIEAKAEAAQTDVLKLSNFFKKVILDDNGEIRLVDKESFRAHVIEDQQTTAETNRQLKGMDDKLLLIIYHLNIDMEDSKNLKGKHK